MVSIGISDKNLQDIYQDSYISKVSYDNKPFEPIDHPLVKYITASIDGRFAGAFMIILFSKTEIEIHSLLKKQFVEHSRQLGREVIDFVFSFYNPQRLTAYIIDGLNTAKNYVIKLGFTLEGIRRDACIKDNRMKNIYIYGLTRREWSIK